MPRIESRSSADCLTDVQIHRGDVAAARSTPVDHFHDPSGDAAASRLRRSGETDLHPAARPMKPVYQRLIARTNDGGFALKRIQGAGFECPWHAHPEIELVLVLQSNGYRIVGDHIAPLRGGDMVLLGSDLPHIWKNHPEGPAPSGIDAILLQFDPGLLGDKIMDLSAFVPIRRLLERAGRGLHFFGPTRDIIVERLRRMLCMPPLQQFIQFVEILGQLAEAVDCVPLASAGWAPNPMHFDQERMNRVLAFIHRSYDQGVRLRDAARVLSLSESAFSRFFRLHMGKTFPAFINELRIGRACRLLIESDKTVTEISYECGFSNLSNFNRQFLRANGVTPRAFRAQLQNQLESDTRGRIS